ncbi:MAG TPA: hypothetical protein PLN89_09150, partial [Elusimicrobiota bacterium]|nr:hypothetical protein [Elusimicrobiota bacterium]
MLTSNDESTANPPAGYTRGEADKNMTEERGKTSGIKRAAATVIALAFVFTSVGEPFAQTSFWAKGSPT